MRCVVKTNLSYKIYQSFRSASNDDQNEKLNQIDDEHCNGQ